jgi:hypothetical protein
MNANGTNQKKVPNSTFSSYNIGGRLISYGGNPSFSPSGRKIIFDSDTNLYTINVDGTNRTRVTNALAGDPYEDKPWFANPAWSPVSNKIAFTWCCGWVETHVLPLSDLSNKQYLDAEHLVAGPEAAHVLADRLHDPGHIHARDGVLRCAESVSEEAKQVRHALHEVPHAPIHARRPDSHENLAVSDLGPFDVPEFEDVGWAVFFLDDRFRGVSPFFDVAICLR